MNALAIDGTDFVGGGKGETDERERHKRHKEVLIVVIVVVVVDEMPLKSALTQIPGIVFLIGIVENIAGPRMEARAWKSKPVSFHSHLLSYPVASRYIFNFALSTSSSSSSSSSRYLLQQGSHYTRPQ